MDAILVFSGDGTYNEALNGAVGAVPFGFLPGGGTSVLPRALGLPRDPVAAAARDRARARAEADSGGSRSARVNGRRFCFSAGLGFDGEAVRRLDALGRDPGGARPGDLAFARMIDADARRAPRRAGTRRSRSRASAAPRSSSSRTAIRTRTRARSPLHIAPEASFEGGIDFVAPTRVRRARRAAARCATSSAAGASSRPTTCSPGHDLDRIVVRCDRPLPLQADGEDLGDVVEAVFEAKRDAVTVLV